MIPAQPRSLLDMRDNPRARERRKYANEPTVVDGLRFDSKAEARRWCELRILERAGEIRGLERQVEYELIPACARPSGGKERATSYRADFVYWRKDRKVVEDVKGAVTAEFRLKRKLMLWRHGIEILETPA